MVFTIHMRAQDGAGSRLKKICLQQIGVNNFNQFNIIEMTGMKDMPNYIISLYKDTIWKNRRASFSRKINNETVMKSIDYNRRFYVNHIIGK